MVPLIALFLIKNKHWASSLIGTLGYLIKFTMIESVLNITMFSLRIDAISCLIKVPKLEFTFPGMTDFLQFNICY